MLSLVLSRVEVNRRYRARHLEECRARERRYNRTVRPLRARRWKRYQCKQHTTCQQINRQAVWDRGKGICHICNSPALPDNWHLEHIVPLKRGGTHCYDNIAVSHPECNLYKGQSVVGDIGRVWYRWNNQLWEESQRHALNVVSRYVAEHDARIATSDDKIRGIDSLFDKLTETQSTEAM